MADWIAKLDDFIRLSDRDILAHAGRVSHQQAEKHAREQYEQYEREQRQIAGADESDFDRAVGRIKGIGQQPMPAKPWKKTKPKKSSRRKNED